MVRFDLGPLILGQTSIAKLKSVHSLLIKMLFIFISMLVGLLRWTDLVSGHRCILGLVLLNVKMSQNPAKRTPILTKSCM